MEAELCNRWRPKNVVRRIALAMGNTTRGETGRDGIGGATGSNKAHSSEGTEESGGKGIHQKKEIQSC